MSSCRLCLSEQIENEIIYETKNFYVVPALGSFIPYYFLIVSKQHINSMAMAIKNSDLNKEYDKIKNKIIKFIKNKAKSDYLIFEHGDCDAKQTTCCVCHAHVHILPNNKKIFNILKETLGKPTGEVKQYTQIKNKINPEQDSYLLLEENNKKFIWKNKIILRQYIRRLVSEQLGKGSEYDWKRYPYHENMQKTITEWLKYKN